ncbi:MAG: alpha/beta hydrolase [Paracoccaceae bacterium]
MRRNFAFCVFLITACSSRGEMTVVPPSFVTGATQNIYVATDRLFDVDTMRFGSKRTETARFARYDVVVPPDRKPGSITYPRPGSTPDPNEDFLTTAAVLYPGEPAFRRDVGQALQKQGREATIFVHGYNNTFAEGVYRIAQLSHDLELPGVHMHYAWPSAGTPFGYVYDRDSTTYSRNGLEAMLREVSASGAERILLVAHSMGSALVVETLRQLALRGDRRTLDRIAGVILISPDIDVDVFRSQARDIGRLPQPFVIFGSTRDKALKLSARLTGQSARLGSLQNVGAVADLEVTFVDVAAFSVGDGHFNVGNSPALIKLMGRIGDVDAAFEADPTSRIGLFPGAVLTVQNATQIILSPIAGTAPVR